jgi:hypothetical protein
MGDLWSVRSKYIFSDYDQFTESQLKSVMKFIQWLIYCYVTFLVFTEHLLEKVQKELRVYLSVHKDLEMMQYVNFKRDFEVEQWIERIHPEWLKVQSSSLPIVNGPILNKFPGDHTIGSLITSQNSNPTTVQSLDILEKKSTENTFEEEFIDFGPDVEDEIRKSNDLLLSMQQQNDRSV